jgi:hypothetical protein
LDLLFHLLDVEFDKINPTTIDLYLHTPTRTLPRFIEHFIYGGSFTPPGRSSATTLPDNNSNRLTAG